MKITFFESQPKRKPDALPGLSIRPSGQVTLNTAAVKLLEAEAGEAATLCYDSEGAQWLIAHWPNGKAGQPELRATSAKGGASLRFQSKGPTAAFYTQLPSTEQDRRSVGCLLAEQALTDGQFPGASFWALTLPDELPSARQPAARAAAAPKTTITKQPGVGRGRYARAGQAQKGVLARG